MKTFPLQARPKSRTLVRLFFISLGLWLVLMGIWLFQSYGPSIGSNPLNSTGEKILLQDSQEWMSIYFNDQKIGYTRTTKQRSTEGYTVAQDLFLRMTVLGFPRQMRLSLSSTLSTDFRLETFTFRMVSGYLNYSIRGMVDGKTLRLSSDLLGRPQTYTLTLKEPPQLPLTLPYSLYRAQMKPGEKATFSLYDPMVMTSIPVTVTAGSTEQLVLEGERQTGQRFEMTLLGNKMTVWIDHSGRVLREEGLMGFRLVHSTPETAQKMGGGTGPDLVGETSIKVLHPPDLKKIKTLILRLSPPPEGIPQTNGRQKVVKNRVIIEQESLSSLESYHLPYSKGDLNPALADHPALSLKDPRLQKALNEALGQEEDAQRAAIRLTDWVYRIIKKQPTLSFPQAVDILSHRQGDCNEHATLLLALLRAAGIPSRLALGVTLLQDRFYYHAWVEAFLGRRWVSLDPTFNQVPADVSHLKLAEGLEEGLVSLLPVIGKLKIEIESAL